MAPFLCVKQRMISSKCVGRGSFVFVLLNVAPGCRNTQQEVREAAGQSSLQHYLASLVAKGGGEALSLASRLDKLVNPYLVIAQP